MRISEITDTDPVLHELLLKLHKGATGGFNAKTTKALLGLFPGWQMTQEVFLKPSDEIGWNDKGFREATAIQVHRDSVLPGRSGMYKVTLNASSNSTQHPTRLQAMSYTAEEAKLQHAAVAKFAVAALPDPKKVKPDQYLVMNLTEPTQKRDEDGDKHWVWSFDLFRKCKGYRITAPDGQHFDVCGPVQILGYGGTTDFAAFFKWALANTDLEDAVNAKLGLAKHLKASERPRIPVGGQTIGTCAICWHQQVVRDNRMVLHGYQRPGHGYVVGNCFGVGHQPYQLSAEACVAYIPLLEEHKADYEKRLADLESGKVTQFYDTKHNYRTNRDENIVIKKGDAQFPNMLRGAIADAKTQISYIINDIQVMQDRITSWKPGTLVRNEREPIAN